jgi:hypothetical protein
MVSPAEQWQHNDQHGPRWNHEFNRAAQLAMCARQLHMLRRTLGDKWPLLRQDDARDAGLAEAKDLAKRLIRVASESVDFYATVDFITQAAHGRLEDMRQESGGRSLIGHLNNTERLTHEHMVPGKVVLDTLTTLKPGARILPVLEALSFRALVSKSPTGSTGWQLTDAYLLDVEFKLKCRLPALQDTSLGARGFRTMDEVPFAFWPLMRYEATGLLDGLIPVNQRARDLLGAYANAAPCAAAA